MHRVKSYAQLLEVINSLCTGLCTELCTGLFCFGRSCINITIIGYQQRTNDSSELIILNALAVDGALNPIKDGLEFFVAFETFFNRTAGVQGSRMVFATKPDANHRI